MQALQPELVKDTVNTQVESKDKPLEAFNIIVPSIPGITLK